MMPKIGILLLIFLAAILFSCGKGDGPEVGNPAPPISLSDLDGEAVSLESLKGKVVIVNLWSYT